MEIIEYRSLNYDLRPKGGAIWLVILHYTGMSSTQEALRRLCCPGSKVSAHYTLDEEGRIYRHIGEEFRAWHAGKSGWRGERDINGCSIGIELGNPGHEFGYCPFTERQMASLEVLLRLIVERYKIKKEGILGHSDVACSRKKDPGELFNWYGLAMKGLGAWPTTAHRTETSREEEEDSARVTEQEVSDLLMTYGYDIELAGSLSTAVTAFQRHFYPEQITGYADQETVRRLQTLVRQANRHT